MNTPASISDGVEGHLARVTSGGRVLTEGEVTNTVTTRRRTCDVHTTEGVVTTTSQILVSTTVGRCGLFIQNRAEDPVYIRFGVDDATTDDWKIGPGEEFRAVDFRYEGEINAISDGASSPVVVIETVEP